MLQSNADKPCNIDIDGDVSVKTLVDVASEEVVVGLTRKDKVKENMLDIAKYYSKPLPPFTKTLAKKSINANIDKYTKRFKEKTLQLLFIDTIKEIPRFSKYLKSLLTKKRPSEEDVVPVTHRVSAITTDTRVEKKEDPSVTLEKSGEEMPKGIQELHLPT
ncbi:hypothetical protein HAX54_003825, partial [Datura stramonium]|nr:hypothetical protein [Datura stramonium]